MSFAGKEVKNPEILKHESKDDVLILISSIKDKEIGLQLQQMGFARDTHFYAPLSHEFSATAILPQVIISIIDHCNLNCKACGSFAPIAEKNHTTLKEHIEDLERLNELFGDNIPTIILMGGEPLLHPDINQLIAATRKFFPLSCLRIFTNGILLPSMPGSFWKTLKKYSTEILVTLYPPVVKIQDKLNHLANKYNVGLDFTEEVSQFFKNLSMAGKGDIVSNFANCKYRGCRYLKKGKICTCAVPIVRKHFNKKFDAKLPEDGIFNIHDPQLTDIKLIKLLDTPFQGCKYCAKEEYFNWTVSKKIKEEWCV